MNSILNKPPFRYDKKRQAIINSDNTVVMLTSGYQTLTQKYNVPSLKADMHIEVFGMLVAEMLNTDQNDL